MKRILLTSALVFVLIFSLVSASAVSCYEERTSVSGTVYIDSLSNGVAGAEVQVTCEDTTLNATTDSSGHYSVNFDISECSLGDEVSVAAVKDSLTGSSEGSVSFSYGMCGCEVNFGLVDVPLIPEFGLLIGGLTVVGAMIAFMVIRRN